MLFGKVQCGAAVSTAAAFLLLLAFFPAEADVGEAAQRPRFHLNSPYVFGAHQHKVQLHTHTTASDGDHEAQWLMQAYEKLGYKAVAITDHDYKRYSASLSDPGGHGIIHIPGVEYSGDAKERSWNHMLGIHIQSIHHADGTGNRQAQIEQATREGGLAFICHPYDESIHRRGWGAQDLLKLVQGYTGIEIHNGASYYDPAGRNYPYKVDLALTSGRRCNVIAVDDFHRNPEEAMDRGYVVINSDHDADTIQLADIIAALASGNYFAAGRISTAHPVSPRFAGISVNGPTITVSTDKLTDITFITHRHNYANEGPNYAQKDIGVSTASFTAEYEDRFVRIQATYTEDGKESHAWSNPIYCEPEEGAN